MSTVTPPRRKRDHVPNSKSSDSLPSPNELLGLGNRRLKTDSCAATLPEDVAMGSVLLKYNLLNLRRAEKAKAEPIKQTSSKTKAKEVAGGTKAAKVSKKNKAAEDAADTATALDEAFVKAETVKAVKVLDVKVTRPRKRKSDEIGTQPISKECASRLAKCAPNTTEDDIHDGAGPTESKVKAAPKPRKRRKTAETIEIDDMPSEATKKASKTRKKTSKTSLHFVTPAHDDSSNTRPGHPKAVVTEETTASTGPDSCAVKPLDDGSAIPVKAFGSLEVVPAKSRRASKTSGYFPTGSEVLSDAESAGTPDEPIQLDIAEMGRTRGAPLKPPTPEKPIETAVASVPSSSHSFAEIEFDPPEIDYTGLPNKSIYDQRESGSASPSRVFQVDSIIRPGHLLEPIPDLQYKPMPIIQEQPVPVVATLTKEHMLAESAIVLPVVQRRKERKKAAPKKKTRLAKKVPSTKAVAPTRKDLAKKSVSPTKKISPKKGPGGITGRSIARYARPESAGLDAVETSNSSPPFALVFTKPTEPTVDSCVHEVLEERTEAKAETEPRTSRAKKGDAKNPSKEQKKKSSGKAKSMPPPASQLASPNQHNAKLKRQDILFGSSSQLRQDLSPNLVRGIQQSLQEPVPEDTELIIDSTVRVQGRHAAAFRSTRRKLWSEGHYAPADGDGGFRDISEFDMPEMVQADVVENVVGSFNHAASTANTSVPVTGGPIPNRHESVPVPSNGFFLRHGDDEPSHISSYLDLPEEDYLIDGFPERPVEADRAHLTRDDLQVETAETFDSGVSAVGTGRFGVFKETTSQPAVTVTAIVISSDSPRQASPPRVALQPLTTNAKSPTKMRAESKPVKKKDATVAEVKAAKKLPRGRPQNDEVADVNAKATKLRGRPRKIAASSPGPRTPQKQDRPQKRAVSGVESSLTRRSADKDSSLCFMDIDDIEDDEPDNTPSPRRKRGSPASTACQELPLTTHEEQEITIKQRNSAIVNASHPRWPTAKAKLFPEITAKVKGAPATSNMKNPSWYEKMLLYDPIVLEDLTNWLNEQGLRIEGKDTALVELSCWMTQAWCEANSVCCLWKEGLRGGVRTRY